MCWRSRLICLSLCLAVTGCRPAAPPEPEVPGPGAAAPSVAPEPAPTGQQESPEPEESSVQLRVLDWDSTLALVRERAGQVVVMDLWSTHCPPCIQEFPELVRLHEELGDRVSCISVSLDLDDPRGAVEEHQPRVQRFLAQQRATFDNVLLSTDAETLFRDKLEHQSMPVVFVYDQAGALAGQFPDPADPSEFTYQEQIVPLVKKLLAER